MRLDSWQPVFLVGVLLAGLGGFGTWAAARDHLRSSAPVQTTTLAEAVQGVELGRRVIVEDLVVDCDQIVSLDGKAYVPGGAPSREDIVVVEVLPDDVCAAIVGRPHEVVHAPEKLVEELVEPPAPDEMILLRGDRPWGWTAIFVGALFVVGLALMGIGLVTRRRLNAELAQLLADAATPRRRRVNVEQASEGTPYRVDESAPVLPRPLRLRKASVVNAQRSGVLFSIAAAVAFVVSLAYLGTSAANQLAARELWDRGTPGTYVQVSGDTRSRWFGLFQSVDAGYVYRDASGEPHVGECNFFAVLGEFTWLTFEVRYDPADPSQHAHSWSTEQAASIWSWILVASAFGVLLAGSLFTVGRRSMAAPRRWRRVLEHPEEVVLQVIAAVPQHHRGAPTGGIEYEFRVPGTDRPMKRLIPKARDEPLFIDDDRRKVLGLLNPKLPDAVIVVRYDLAPLDIDPESMGEIRERARAMMKQSRRAT